MTSSMELVFLGSSNFFGSRRDTGKNVKCGSGIWPEWIPWQYGTTGVPVAIEFQRFLLDDWTVEPVW